MLVLSRKRNESVVVGAGRGRDRLLKITVVEIVAGKVRLGFEGDDDVLVYREELWDRMCANGEVDGVGLSPETPNVASSE